MIIFLFSTISADFICTGNHGYLTIDDDTSSNSCPPCPDGYFRENDVTIITDFSSKTCTGCLCGGHDPLNGSGICEDCGVGQGCDVSNTCHQFCNGFCRYRNDVCETKTIPDEAICVPCALGQYGKDSGTTTAQGCDICPFGTYQDELGQQDCKLCSPGEFSGTNTSRTTPCDLCPAGTYQIYAGQQRCISCPIGTYSSITGATTNSCKKCENGKKTLQAGSASITDCISSVQKLASNLFLVLALLKENL